MIKLRRQRTREEVVADDPLGEFLVWWDDVYESHVRGLKRRLSTATAEPELQEYLERDPILLIQHLGGGHGRWVIPTKRLGSEYITDFVICERSSLGFE